MTDNITGGGYVYSTEVAQLTTDTPSSSPASDDITGTGYAVMAYLHTDELPTEGGGGDCGITDSFNRTSPGALGVSDAGIMWVAPASRSWVAAGAGFIGSTIGSWSDDYFTANLSNIFELPLDITIDVDPMPPVGSPGNTGTNPPAYGFHYFSPDGDGTIYATVSSTNLSITITGPTDSTVNIPVSLSPGTLYSLHLSFDSVNAIAIVGAVEASTSLTGYPAYRVADFYITGGGFGTGSNQYEVAHFDNLLISGVDGCSTFDTGITDTFNRNTAPNLTIGIGPLGISDAGILWVEPYGGGRIFALPSAYANTARLYHNLLMPDDAGSSLFYAFPFPFTSVIECQIESNYAIASVSVTSGGYLCTFKFATMPSSGPFVLGTGDGTWGGGFLYIDGAEESMCAGVPITLGLPGNPTGIFKVGLAVDSTGVDAWLDSTGTGGYAQHTSISWAAAGLSPATDVTEYRLWVSTSGDIGTGFDNLDIAGVGSAIVIPGVPSGPPVPVTPGENRPDTYAPVVTGQGTATDI